MLLSLYKEQWVNQRILIMKPSILKQIAAQAGLVVTLISITGAIVLAINYFATQAELATVKQDLRTQKKENDCRIWLIRSILERRINIFEKEDTYVELSKASKILEKLESSKTASLSKQDRHDANEANKKLAEMQSELQQIRQDEDRLRRILDQPSVLTESGECVGGR